MSLCRDPDHPARDPRTRVTRRLRDEVVCHGVDDDATAYDGIAPLKRMSGSVQSRWALPSLSAVTFPKSPTWRSLLIGAPCGIPSGLKWPPAESHRRGAVAILMDVKAVEPRRQPLQVRNYLDAGPDLGEGNNARDLVACGRIKNRDGFYHLLVTSGLTEGERGGAKEQEGTQGKQHHAISHRILLMESKMMGGPLSPSSFINHNRSPGRLA